MDFAVVAVVLIIILILYVSCKFYYSSNEPRRRGHGQAPVVTSRRVDGHQNPHRGKMERASFQNVEESVEWFYTKILGGVVEDLKPIEDQDSDFHAQAEGGRLESTRQKQLMVKLSGQASKTQFAYVLLFPTTRQKQTDFDIEVRVNRKVPCMPDRREDYDNFLVAQPHNGKHAEEIILEKFDELWNAYKRKHGAKPGSVYLYSFLMPCTKCTDKILDTLGGKTVTIKYTSKNFERNEYPNVQVQEKNRQRLRDKDDFTVRRYF